MTVRYPIPGVTKHGAYHLLRNDIPWMWLESADRSVVIDLMGGRSMTDRRAPESVQLLRDGIKGLVPPWRTIDQKGATQDGVTWIDSLYDPAEVTLTVMAVGRDQVHVREVVRHLIGALDTKAPCRLHFWTQDAGHWWADLRWFKTLPDVNNIAHARRQRLTLVMRADDAFWRSDDSVDLWAPSYEAMSDTFNFTAGSAEATSLGENWPLFYIDQGGGYISADGSKAVWNDQPGWNTGDRSVVAGPYKDFATDTDYQIVIMTTGSSPQFAIPKSGFNDAWVRMGRNVDGTWDGYGVRFRVGWSTAELARFNGFVTDSATAAVTLPASFGAMTYTTIPGLDPADFAGEELVYALNSNTGTARDLWLRCRVQGSAVQLLNPLSLGSITVAIGDQFRTVRKTVMAHRKLWWPPKISGDTWTILAGIEGDPRLFTVQRNGLDLLTYKEGDAASAMGADYRGIGFGMSANGMLITQATPASVKKIVAADNITVAQEGYLRRTNIGDQGQFDRLTVFGPGTFRFWIGPDAGAQDYVEFGPLLPNQVVQIDTDPRHRSVQDLTSVPPTQQELTAWQKVIDKFLDNLGGASSPLITQIKSQWGILPPQGALYSLLKGRFSDAAAIPPKSPGASVKPYYVKVSVDNGTAQSKVIAAGTPRRRYPL